MNLGNYYTRTRLAAGFAIVVGLTAVMGALGIAGIWVLSNYTTMLYDHPLIVGRTARDIRGNIHAIQALMEHIDMAADAQEINHLISEMNVYERETHPLFDVAREKFLGDSALLERAHNNFVKWQPIREQIVRLVQAQELDKAAAMMRGPNASHRKLMLQDLNEVVAFSSNKAEQFYLSAQSARKWTVIVMWVLLCDILLTSGIVALVITRSITGPLEKIVKSVQRVAIGDLRESIKLEQADEMGELAAALRQLQDDLRERALAASRIAVGDFSQRVQMKSSEDSVAQSINMISENFTQVVRQARAIASGDFNIEFAPRSKNDELGLALVEMVQSLKEVVAKSKQIASGDYSGRLTAKSDKDELALSINRMTDALCKTTTENERQNWVRIGRNRLNERMRGDLDVYTLTYYVITFLAEYMDAQLGAIYLLDKTGKWLELVSTYAFMIEYKGLNEKIQIGEGLVGQAALDKKTITVTDVPDSYFRVSSALGKGLPRNIVVAPILREGQLLGVIELATFKVFSATVVEFLDVVLRGIGVSILSAQARENMAALLEKTQSQAELLQSQHEEILQSNEELTEQAQALRESESRLQAQQEELRIINEELAARTKTAEAQRDALGNKNDELLKVQSELEKKAAELEKISRYKSEFLAKMSHELRTPLNSILILSKLLSQNKFANLSERQVESADTIQLAGAQLLSLINDVLDLSKVEAGKLAVNLAWIDIPTLTRSIELIFRETIENTKLIFSVDVADTVPVSIRTDEQRVQQVLKNLLSNAFKFTSEGSVTLRIFRPGPEVDLSQSGLLYNHTVAFAVCDTGPGISEDKQEMVFDAFQQEDQTTSRKFGGTGLGLSIARELATLLGGELHLSSKAGQGSVFTLYLPENPDDVKKPDVENPVEAGKDQGLPPSAIAAPQNKDESESEAVPGLDDKIILVIEDDPAFANVLCKLAVEKGFQCLVATDGETGLCLAIRHRPNAIILDIGLPLMDGWTVMGKLKGYSETRHIPVHIVSGLDRPLDGLRMGAVGFLTKPATPEQLDGVFSKLEAAIARPIRKLLLVEDDEAQRKSIVALVGNGDVRTTAVESGEEACRLLEREVFDCVIVDLSLKGEMSGFDFVARIRKEESMPKPPIIIYTAKDLSLEETNELSRYAESIIIKGARSPERLLVETSLFLHRIEANMPEEKRKILRMVYDKEQALEGKKILIVDDDMRNVFALSNVLEEKGVNVIAAKDGKSGLEKLEKDQGIDLVLMDIMMPVMDGYEAIREIRKHEKWAKLPIIALTAKAMKSDKHHCIEAGASDYMAKPVDIDRLLSLIRVWLYK